MVSSYDPFPNPIQTNLFIFSHKKLDRLPLFTSSDTKIFIYYNILHKLCFVIFSNEQSLSDRVAFCFVITSRGKLVCNVNIYDGNNNVKIGEVFKETGNVLHYFLFCSGDFVSKKLKN